MFEECVAIVERYPLELLTVKKRADSLRTEAARSALIDVWEAKMEIPARTSRPSRASSPPTIQQ